MRRGATKRKKGEHDFRNEYHPGLSAQEDTGTFEQVIGREIDGEMAILTSRTGRTFTGLRIIQIAILLAMLGLIVIYGVHLNRLGPPSMPLEFTFSLIAVYFPPL